MTILVIAEHDNVNLSHMTASVVFAATKISTDIHLLVVGSNCKDNVAQEASLLDNVAKVIVADNHIYKNFLAENLSNLVKDISGDYTHILAAASTCGKESMPRIAALLDVAQISDITDIINDNTFVRPVYAGNALATVKSSDLIKIITVRSSAFEKAESGGSAEIIELSAGTDTGLSSFVCKDEMISQRPELTSASTIVSGGRGVGSIDGFKLIEQLADVLGGAVGASRAAVDAGYVSNDAQIGQTGKIVAPNLYIAAGISGAIQHIAGIKDSKIIVAINKDENAPIFDIADYGIVADLFDTLPELNSKLSE